jgi:hypothetical protein
MTELERRQFAERVIELHKVTYKNPFLLATLYYTEGYSTVEIAELLECEQRTVRRYMNLFGLRRFTKRFSLLVKHHGIEGACKIMRPEFYPIGRYEV